MKRLLPELGDVLTRGHANRCVGRRGRVAGCSKGAVAQVNGVSRC